jgi:hypothetical protein
MITNADMNTATEETYKAMNSQITQNNGTWSLTQTSQGLSFSVNYKNQMADQNNMNMEHDQFDYDFDTLSMVSDDSGDYTILFLPFNPVFYPVFNPTQT